MTQQLQGVRRPDMGRFVSYLEARRAEAAKPLHAQMLDVLIEHCIAEVRDLDIERTMNTLIDEPVYHWWGDLSVMRRFGASPQRVLNRAQIQADYEEGMRIGTLRMDALEVGVDRFFINDDAIAWDGPTYLVLPGALLAQVGEELPDGGTAADLFVQVSRCAIFISFQDGRMVGEDYYVDGGAEYYRLQP